MTPAPLRLVPYAPGHLVTLREAPERFAAEFGHPVAEGMHEMLTSGDVSAAWVEGLRRDAAAEAGPDPWTYGFAVVHPESDEVIGTAAFVGPPDEQGMVEIAYGIAPAYRAHGYATGAARALIDFAARDGRVVTVRAHTLPHEGPSPRILEKCGFAFVGEVEVPEDGLVWRWERPIAG